MKVFVDTDELYPYFSLDAPENREWHKPSDFRDISAELYERYRKAQIEFFAVQRILEAMENS